MAVDFTGSSIVHVDTVGMLEIWLRYGIVEYCTIQISDSASLQESRRRVKTVRKFKLGELATSGTR
jgi:hypothetical protein